MKKVLIVIVCVLMLGGGFIFYSTSKSESLASSYEVIEITKPADEEATELDENESEVDKKEDAKDKVLVDNYIYAEPFEVETSDGIKVIVDPSIEAAQLVVEIIGRRTNFTLYAKSSYMADQEEHFKQFEDHRVFKLAKIMQSQHGFAYDAVPSIVHYFDENAKLKEGLILKGENVERAGGEEMMKDFMKALYEFRAYSDYDSYFLANEERYMKEITKTKDVLEGLDIISNIEDYYGYLKGDITIHISPGLGGGFGCSNEYKDGFELLPTIGSTGDKDKFALFLWHELSHAYVNPQTQKYPDKVEKTSDLLTPIKGSMKKQAYGTWETSLNEHIVRANVIEMAKKAYGQKKADEILLEELSFDFIYEEDILAFLEDYTSNRTTYKTFDDYFEILMDKVSQMEKYETMYYQK